MRLFRSAYCAKRTKVHTVALSETDVVHKVLDGGALCAILNRAAQLRAVMQRQLGALQARIYCKTDASGQPEPSQRNPAWPEEPR